ncbi:flippase [Idiomarina sp. HP20-50]|uniref:flippase n=1 Tax=Idiomarina sp. HP20-50 TaxID=3070813 RepID=UPI00294B55DE|nr:flippase [Idiomarina sp. HP20-50]MDV6316108.1 flippase [Idiomarina sp. HP20-50]
MSAFLLKFRHFTSGTILRRNIGMTFGRQVISAILQLIVVVIIARELGPEGNGIYAMTILVPTLMSNFLSLGIGSATVYHLSKGDFSVSQIINGNLKLGLYISFVGIIVAYLIITYWGNKIFPGIPSNLLFLGLLSFPITLLLSFLNAIFQGLEDFKAFNLTVMLPPVIMLVGTSLALYVFDLKILSLIYVFIASQLSALIATLVLLKRSKLNSKENEPSVMVKRSTSYNRKILKFGWKAHLSNIITFINYRADLFLVNFFISPAAAGIYIIAIKISEKLWMPSQAVSTVTYPRLSTMTNDPIGRLKLTKKAFYLVALITAAISLISALILVWFVGPLFGHEYKSVLPAFLCLVPGVILWAGARVQASCIAAAGRPEWNMYISIAVLAINISGNLMLIPRYGILGAAIATSIAYAFDSLVKYYFVNKTSNIEV